MRIPRLLTIVVAVAALALLLGAGYVLSRPRGPVLVSASLVESTITPNADGDTDVTELQYRLRRAADVSITFVGADGETYHFRTDEPRIRGDYRVLFGGVVDPYVRPGETFQGEVMSRLLADGEYEWIVEAEDALTGQVDSLSGTLTVKDADSELPDLWEFTVAPEVFTPNQDGLDDLIWVNVYVPKDATLSVYLLDEEGTRYLMPESQEESQPDTGGRHTFIYDGGVDMGRNPPPDGHYTVRVEATDDEGQTVQREAEVDIAFGGLPLAEIVGQPLGDTVRFSSETVLLGDVLSFELTVENYGDAPIRTTGPAPGYVYEQDELYPATGFFQESGAWRVGIHCDTCETDYPWRWGLGDDSTLTALEDSEGREHLYLMPGERAVITGGVRLTNIVDSRNPQEFWAGLIHEDVAIAPANQRVDPHWIKIEPVDEVSGDS